MNDDENARRISSSSDEFEEEEEEEMPPRTSKPKTSKRESIILGLRYAPDGMRYITDDKGQRVKLDEMVECLKHAYSDSILKRHDEINLEKEAALKAAIREETRYEAKDTELRSASSDVQIMEMSMRYVPENNPRPMRTDPIYLFKHETKMPSIKIDEAPSRGVEFVNILAPSFTKLGRIESTATVPSTVARRYSKDSVRGSALSTHLSDMPSMFSQALIEDPSAQVFMTASTQEFDITRKSVNQYREQWLSDFMTGNTPKETFTICIINMITRRPTELRVSLCTKIGSHYFP